VRMSTAVTGWTVTNLNFLQCRKCRRIEGRVTKKADTLKGICFLYS